MKNDIKWSLILFSVGVFMAALDNGIITSSLTTLISSFAVSQTWGAWTITVYTLGLAISVPIVGKLSDRYGRRSLFLCEVALFGIGSLLVALSPNFSFFLAARFLQAMGGGGIFIIASSYVLNTVPQERQGRALGMLGGMNGIAAILGPNVGSFILDLTGSWHWLFLINVPVAIILFLVGWKYIHEQQTLQRTKLDLGGITALSGAMVLLMLTFTKLDGVDLLSGLGSATFLSLIGGSIVLILALIAIEQRVHKAGQETVLPLKLMSRSTFRLALLLSFFSGAILASVIFIPGFVEQFLNVSSAQAGYWFTPLALASGIGAGGGGALVDKKGPIYTLVLASVLAIVGFLLFPLWVDSGWQMIIASCLVGLGFGIMLGAPINVLVSEHAGDNKGISLATSSLFRQMGMTLAPTIYAGFLARAFSDFGTQVKDNLEAANISGVDQMMSHMPKSTDATSIKEGIAQIPDPQIREILQDTLHEAVGNGFNGLYLASMVVSCAMLVAVVWLGVVRSKRSKDLPAQPSNS